MTNNVRLNRRTVMKVTGVGAVATLGARMPRLETAQPATINGNPVTG